MEITAEEFNGEKRLEIIKKLRQHQLAMLYYLSSKQEGEE